ncbi:glycosyltransferase [Pseudobutyrivibrio ruminis]|uniref:glycosyltransferase n=1 Tax=Pseudobutyrivibrio ruminis TaxID=46206 RepID=UPI00041B8ABC|nr:glycosyltransferase [Pseudobutyrivibrio ruminis]
MNNPLISIVTPVYNNRKYLPLAVESVINQRFKDWEMIIVDDGSTDDTGDIADLMMKRDSRIRVIHQDNQWIYASLNNGVSISRGEYIYFLNSDDRIIENALEIMAEAISKYNWPDLIWTDVIVNILNDSDELISQYVLSGGVEDLYCDTKYEVRRNSILFQRKKLSLNQANLYKRNIIKNVSFRNDVYGADTLFNIELLPSIESCVVLKKPLYLYYEHQNNKGNASAKIYGYENSMFNEFFINMKNVLIDFSMLTEEALYELSNERVNNFKAIEVKKIIESDISCSKKIECLFSTNITKPLMDAVININGKEDFDRYVLRKADSVLKNYALNDKDRMYFVRELLDAITSSTITDEILLKAKKAVYNPLNAFRIGEEYYKRLLIRRRIEENVKKEKAKKVLWLGNIVLPELADILLIKQTNFGGWMSAIWRLVNNNKDYSFAICVPIQKAENCKDGELASNKYYSFLECGKENIDQMVNRFEEIIDNYQPDIVHIWGTEYVHTYAMMLACENKGILDKTVIHIQGLISQCGESLFNGLTSEMRHDDKLMKSIIDYQNSFRESGICEKKALKMARHIIGRTQWDKEWSTKLAPYAQYHVGKEIMRNEIYAAQGRWRVDECKPHTIFMSQASYPLKGLHLVLKVFAKLKEIYPDLMVRIAGVNPLDANKEYGEYIFEQIQCLQLYENIEFIGNCDVYGMIEEYEKANVYLLASTIENSSNSVQEAMIIGIPIVASNVGGIPSLIEHGQTGFLYDLDNSEILISQIIKIFEDSEMAKEVSINEIAKASLISEEDIKEKTLKLYSEL